MTNNPEPAKISEEQQDFNGTLENLPSRELGDPTQRAQELDETVESLSSREPGDPANANPSLESTRARLAVLLTGSLIGTIVAVFLLILAREIAYVVSGKIYEDNGAKDLITLIWTSQTALTGSALGFYFSSRDSDP